VDQDAIALELSRRTFLRLVGASGLAAIGGSLLTPGRTLAVPTIGDLTALRGAMHVHTSFSEGTASLHSQLEEAALNGFDVFWPTDHDWRMSNYQAPTTFHFTGLTETVTGKNYTWKPATSGSLASSAGSIVTTLVSPNDSTASKGSLKVEVTSSGSAAASRRYLMDGTASNTCHRTNLAGQTLMVDVFPDQAGQNAWAEVLVTMSYRPATGASGGHVRPVVPGRLGSAQPISTGVARNRDHPARHRSIRYRHPRSADRRGSTVARHRRQ